MGGTQYVGDVDTSSKSAADGEQNFYGGINFGDIPPPRSAVIADTLQPILLLALPLIAIGAYILIQGK